MAQTLTSGDRFVNSAAAAPKPGLADPAKAPHAAAKAREARFDDYHQIVVLQSRNGLSTRSYADWSALSADNPAYSQLNRRLPIGWVLQVADEEVGGYVGNLTAHSWAVDAAYRCHSVKLQYRFLKHRDVDLFVQTTPNAAERVLRALEFSRLNSGRWDQTGFWIIGYRGFAKSARAASMTWPSVLAYPLPAAPGLCCERGGNCNVYAATGGTRPTN